MSKPLPGDLRSPFSITDCSGARLLLLSGLVSALLWAIIALVL